MFIYTPHMSMPKMIDVSLPEEQPHPAAGSVCQVFHSPESVWIYRETDSHLVSLTTGEITCSISYETLVDFNDREFNLERNAKFWRSPDGNIITRMRLAPNANVRVTSHDARTGELLWETDIHIEQSTVEKNQNSGPQYPNLFFVAGTPDPIVCALYARDDQLGLVTHGLSKDDGSVVWSNDTPEAFVDILSRNDFNGVFLTPDTVARIDFESGTIHQTDPLPKTPMWPTRINGRIYYASCDSSGATAWATDNQCSSPEPVLHVDQKRVTDAQVYDAGGQPVLRVNQNAIWFMSTQGKETQIKFKPWVYGVAASEGGPLFVMTDGNGGRMLAYDRADGKVLLNLKPTIGGYGSHAYLENHALIVAAEVTKRDWSQRALRIFSTTNCKHSRLPIGGYLLSAHHDHALIQARDSQDPNSFTLLDLREARSLL